MLITFLWKTTRPQLMSKFPTANKTLLTSNKLKLSYETLMACCPAFWLILLKTEIDFKSFLIPTNSIIFIPLHIYKVFPCFPFPSQQKSSIYKLSSHLILHLTNKIWWTKQQKWELALKTYKIRKTKIGFRRLYKSSNPMKL